jgi:hypothetical protein
MDVTYDVNVIHKRWYAGLMLDTQSENLERYVDMPDRNCKWTVFMGNSSHSAVWRLHMLVYAVTS